MKNGEKGAVDQDQEQIKIEMRACDRYRKHSNGITGDHPPLVSQFVDVLLIAVIVILCQSAVVVEAADWKLSPSIGVSGGYDDNVLFQDDKLESSFVFVEPVVELDYESLLSSLRMRADWVIQSYLDESDLNRVNQYYRLDGDHQLTQRLDTRAGFRYIKDSTLNTYLEETGQVIERLDRDYLYAMGGASYNLSSVSWISADYVFETAQYQADIYPDYDRHRVNLRYRHRLKSQQDILSFGPSYYYRTNVLNDTDYYSLDIGWERDWNDITNSRASIGVRYADVQYDEQNSDSEDRSDWGVRARLDFNRQGLASNTTFRYYHDVDTTAAGTDVNVDNFYIEYERLLTERFGIGIDGRLVLSYNLFGNNESDGEEVNDQRYYEIRPFLRYRLLPNMNVSLRYSYQNSSSDLVDSQDTRDRNRIWLQFYYYLPDML